MILFILVWALCNLGFIALASSMSKHQKQIFDQELAASQTKLVTLLGWVFLMIALAVCLRHGDSISNMMSYWIGVLSFSALALGLLFSYYSQHIKAFAIGSALFALCCIGLINFM